MTPLRPASQISLGPNWGYSISGQKSTCQLAVLFWGWTCLKCLETSWGSVYLGGGLSPWAFLFLEHLVPGSLFQLSWIVSSRVRNGKQESWSAHSYLGFYCLQSSCHGFILSLEWHSNFHSCLTEKKNKAQYLAQSHTNSKCHPYPWQFFSLSVVGASLSNRNFVPGQLLAVNQSHHKDPVSSCRWLWMGNEVSRPVLMAFVWSALENSVAFCTCAPLCCLRPPLYLNSACTCLFSTQPGFTVDSLKVSWISTAIRNLQGHYSCSACILI